MHDLRCAAAVTVFRHGVNTENRAAFAVREKRICGLDFYIEQRTGAERTVRQRGNRRDTGFAEVLREIIGELCTDFTDKLFRQRTEIIGKIRKAQTAELRNILLFRKTEGKLFHVDYSFMRYAITAI